MNISYTSLLKDTIQDLLKSLSDYTKKNLNTLPVYQYNEGANAIQIQTTMIQPIIGGILNKFNSMLFTDKGLNVSYFDVDDFKKIQSSIGTRQLDKTKFIGPNVDENFIMSYLSFMRNRNDKHVYTLHEMINSEDPEQVYDIVRIVMTYVIQFGIKPFVFSTFPTPESIVLVFDTRTKILEEIKIFSSPYSMLNYASQNNFIAIKPLVSDSLKTVDYLSKVNYLQNDCCGFHVDIITFMSCLSLYSDLYNERLKSIPFKTKRSIYLMPYYQYLTRKICTRYNLNLSDVVLVHRYLRLFYTSSCITSNVGYLMGNESFGGDSIDKSAIDFLKSVTKRIIINTSIGAIVGLTLPASAHAAVTYLGYLSWMGTIGKIVLPKISNNESTMSNFLSKSVNGFADIYEMSTDKIFSGLKSLYNITNEYVPISNILQENIESNITSAIFGSTLDVFCNVSSDLYPILSKVNITIRDVSKLLPEININASDYHQSLVSGTFFKTPIYKLQTQQDSTMSVDTKPTFNYKISLDGVYKLYEKLSRTRVDVDNLYNSYFTSNFNVSDYSTKLHNNSVSKIVYEELQAIYDELNSYICQLDIEKITSQYNTTLGILKTMLPDNVKGQITTMIDKITDSIQISNFDSLKPFIPQVVSDFSSKIVAYCLSIIIVASAGFILVPSMIAVIMSVIPLLVVYHFIPDSLKDIVRVYYNKYLSLFTEHGAKAVYMKRLNTHYLPNEKSIEPYHNAYKVVKNKTLMSMFVYDAEPIEKKTFYSFKRDKMFELSPGMFNNVNIMLSLQNSSGYCPHIQHANDYFLSCTSMNNLVPCKSGQNPDTFVLYTDLFETNLENYEVLVKDLYYMQDTISDRYLFSQLVLYNVCEQVINGIKWLNSNKIQHNNMTIENVHLVRDFQSTSFDTKLENQVLSVPNIGVKAIIGGFDMSRFVGTSVGIAPLKPEENMDSVTSATSSDLNKMLGSFISESNQLFQKALSFLSMKVDNDTMLANRRRLYAIELRKSGTLFIDENFDMTTFFNSYMSHPKLGMTCVASEMKKTISKFGDYSVEVNYRLPGLEFIGTDKIYTNISYLSVCDTSGDYKCKPIGSVQAVQPAKAQEESWWKKIFSL